MLIINDDGKQKFQSVTVSNSLISDITDIAYCEGYGYTREEALEDFKETYKLWKQQILEKLAEIDKQIEDKMFIEVDYNGRPLDKTIVLDRWKSVDELAHEKQ